MQQPRRKGLKSWWNLFHCWKSVCTETHCHLALTFSSSSLSSFHSTDRRTQVVPFNLDFSSLFFFIIYLLGYNSQIKIQKKNHCISLLSGCKDKGSFFHTYQDLTWRKCPHPGDSWENKKSANKNLKHPKGFKIDHTIIWCPWGHKLSYENSILFIFLENSSHGTFEDCENIFNLFYHYLLRLFKLKAAFTTDCFVKHNGYLNYAIWEHWRDI